jgi:hypothetical protein
LCKISVLFVFVFLRYRVKQGVSLGAGSSLDAFHTIFKSSSLSCSPSEYNIFLINDSMLITYKISRRIAFKVINTYSFLSDSIASVSIQQNLICLLWFQKWQKQKIQTQQ